MPRTTTTTGLVTVSSSPKIQIFYLVNGSLDGSRPVILLSNSLAANVHLWDAFTAEFVRKYTIIRYDARFHGQSPLSPDGEYDYAKGHTIDDLTDDVLRLLDHLKIQRLTAFIGLSIGAAVGLTFGAKHPDRVDKVFVIGTKAISTPETNQSYNARIAYGRREGREALGKQSVSRWFSPDWMARHPEETAFVEDIVIQQSLEGFEGSIAALRQLNLRPVSEDIGRRKDGARFVFVAGEYDSTIPVESRQLAEIAGSEMVIITDCGHIVNVQQPERLYELVRRVLG